MPATLPNITIYKDSLLIFISKLLVSLARVVGTFLFSYHLSQADYGIYQNYWVQFTTLFAFASLSLSTATFSYSPQKLIDILHVLKRKNIVVGSGIALMIGVIFASMQHKVGAALGWSFLFLIFQTGAIIGDALLTVFKKFKPLLWINISYFLIFILIHLWCLFVVEYSFNTFVMLISLLSLAKSLAIIASLKSVVKIYAPQPIVDTQYKRLWLHLYIFDIIQIFLAFSDKFILSLLVSPDVSAVYQNGTYAIPILSVLFSAVSSAVFIHLAEVKNDMLKEIAILKQAGKILSLVALPLFFFFLFFGKEFVLLVFSDKYLASVPIFSTSILAIPFNVFNYTLILQRKEQGSTITKGLVLDVVCVLLFVYPLYKWLGLPGIPLAYVLSTACQTAYYLWHHQMIFEKPLYFILPLYNWLIKAIVFAIISAILYFVTVDVLALSSLWAMAVSLVIIGIAVLLFFIKEIKKSDL